MCLLRFENNFLTIGHVRFCFENNLLTIKGVRFASISKKTLLSKLSFAFVSLALPLLPAIQFIFTVRLIQILTHLSSRWTVPLRGNITTVWTLKNFQRLKMHCQNKVHGRCFQQKLFFSFLLYKIYFPNFATRYFSNPFLNIPL